MVTPSEWKAFIRPLTAMQTSTVIADLFDRAEEMRAANAGPCLACKALNLQASPPRILTADILFPGYGSTSDAEVIRQVGWAWLAAWVVSESPPDRTTLDRLARMDSSGFGMPASHWAWIQQALELAGLTPFASVSIARAAVP